MLLKVRRPRREGRRPLQPIEGAGPFKPQKLAEDSPTRGLFRPLLVLSHLFLCYRRPHSFPIITRTISRGRANAIDILRAYQILEPAAGSR